MTDLALHLRLAGALLVGIGLMHAVLPRALAWETDLAGVSLATRQVSYVHTFFIGLTCLLFGSLALTHADALLVPAPLAAAVLGGMTLFWAARLAIQVVGFDPALWRGDPARTGAHVVFVAIWMYETAVFGGALLVQLGGSVP